MNIKLCSAVLVLLLVAACDQSPEQQAKKHSRDVISVCWDDQKTKSYDPSMARFVASVCEKMEREFHAEYKHKP